MDFAFPVSPRKMKGRTLNEPVHNVQQILFSLFRIAFSSYRCQILPPPSSSFVNLMLCSSYTHCNVFPNGFIIIYDSLFPTRQKKTKTKQNKLRDESHL